MTLRIQAFADSDDALIVWRSPHPIPDCIGFELRRRRNGKPEVVRNRVSFSGGAPNPNQPESSATSPLRRYAWTDHEVNTGDRVSYQVAPVVQPEGGAPSVREAEASPFSNEVELTGKASASFERYLNRGFAISQLMSRLPEGDRSDKPLETLQQRLESEPESQLRVFPGGDLRRRLLNLPDAAGEGGGLIFFDQGGRLRDASDETGPSIVDVWFARSSNAREMDAVIELVKGSQEGVVFLMFQPGKSPILDAIASRETAHPSPLIKGVISTEDANEDGAARVEVVQRGGMPVRKSRAVRPRGRKSAGAPAGEVSRSEFGKRIGFAIVHSMVLVIDPNGEKPVVITGARSKNEENLVIITGDRALAQAYAVNVQAVYDHYNFRAVAAAMQQEGSKTANVMTDPKSWQQSWFQGDKERELDFWLGRQAQAAIA